MLTLVFRYEAECPAGAFQPPEARPGVMIPNDRQVFRHQPIQQAQPRPDTEIAVGVVNALGLREIVGQRIVEGDVAGQTPATIKQKSHMPGSVAGRGQGVNAGKELFLVVDQSDTIS